MFVCVGEYIDCCLVAFSRLIDLLQKATAKDTLCNLQSEMYTYLRYFVVKEPSQAEMAIQYVCS